MECKFYWVETWAGERSRKKRAGYSFRVRMSSFFSLWCVLPPSRPSSKAVLSMKFPPTSGPFHLHCYHDHHLVCVCWLSAATRTRFQLLEVRDPLLVSPIIHSLEYSGCSWSALYTVGTHEIFAGLSYLETSITESSVNSYNNSGEVYVYVCVYMCVCMCAF